MRLSKKRLLMAAGGVTAMGAAATLVAGVTFGLFSGSQPGSANTFATGTVSIGSPVSTVCTVTNMVPGDESAGYVGVSGDNVTGNTQATKDITCKFAVTYTGTAPAYIGLSTAVSGNLPLVWEISQGAADGAAAPAFTTSGAINTNTTANPLYVATDTGTQNGGGKTYTFWVDYALPTNYTTQSNTGASLTLTAYAVQSGNNGSGTCTVGQQCVPTGVNAWS